MTRRKADLLAAVAAAVLFIAYSGAWFFIAAQIENQIALLPQQAAQNGIALEGTFSGVTGFPFPPQVHFSGSVRGPQGTAVISDLQAEGFPLPGQTIRLTAPQGAHLEPGANGKSLDSELWSASFVAVTVAIPFHLPRDGTAESLKAWQQQDGQIVIKSFSLRKDSLDVKARGVLALDEYLQPAGQLHAEIGGYEDFLGYLKRKGLVKGKQGFFIQAALAVLARTDPQSGKSYLAADLTLQKQELFLGPLEILALPAVQWPD